MVISSVKGCSFSLLEIIFYFIYQSSTTITTSIYSAAGGCAVLLQLHKGATSRAMDKNDNILLSVRNSGSLSRLIDIF
jgi:hypothetical protein